MLVRAEPKCNKSTETATPPNPKNHRAANTKIRILPVTVRKEDLGFTIASLPKRERIYSCRSKHLINELEGIAQKSLNLFIK